METILTVTPTARSPLAPEEGIELTPYNSATLYSPEAAAGYVDYPFANEVAPLQA